MTWSLLAAALLPVFSTPASAVLEPDDLDVDCASLNVVPACPRPAEAPAAAGGRSRAGAPDRCADAPNQTENYEHKVRSVFEDVRRAAALPEAALSYTEEVHAECKDVGVAAEDARPDWTPALPPTVHVCASILRRFASDRGTLYFVLAHELGHLKSRDATGRREFARRFIGEWFRAKPAPYLSDENRERAGKDLSADLCPALFGVARRQEDAADVFAVDLIQGLGCDPEIGAQSVQRQWDFLTSIGRAGERRSHSSTRARVERIRQEGQKRLGELSQQLSAPGFQ